ncbi:MAG: PqqD family protein [Nitrospirota bacterium]
MDTNGLVILNETGRYIWELLAKECSVDDLATALSERFGLDITRARADVQVFINDVSDHGLVEQ